MILLNPKRRATRYRDERSDALVQKTIDFFEQKGKARLRKDPAIRTMKEEVV